MTMTATKKKKKNDNDKQLNYSRVDSVIYFSN